MDLIDDIELELPQFIEESSSLESLLNLPKLIGKGKRPELEFGKLPEEYPFKLQIGLVKIDEQRKVIAIQNINVALLSKRIRETFNETHMDKIFRRAYGKKDLDKYFKKKINKSRMKVLGIITPLFFALELIILFNGLSKVYKDPKYKKIAKDIYENSWVKAAETKKVPDLDTTVLRKLVSPEYELLPHQIEFIKNYSRLKTTLNLRGLYNAFDQGLGKTLTAFCLALCLKVDKIYIVCPNNLVNNWILEINQYTNSKLKIVNCKEGKIDRSAQVFIINNESIPKMSPVVDPTKKSILIVDEAHNFRSFTSKRVMELLDLRQMLEPQDILLMSGTPLKATPTELIPAFLLLDPLFTTPAARIYNSCFNISRYDAMEIVTARLGKVIYRKLKSDVLNLPEKYTEDLKLPLPNSERFLLSKIGDEVADKYAEFYPIVIKNNEQILETFTTLVNKYSMATERETKWYLDKITRASNVNDEFTMDELHELSAIQITSFLSTMVLDNPEFPKSEKTKIIKAEKMLINFRQSAMGKAIGSVYPPKRTEVFSELWTHHEGFFIEKIDKNIKKTVIFTQFAKVANHIANRLNMQGIGNVLITGSVPNGERLSRIEKFKYDEDYQVLVATSQTLGTGFTFTVASQMFFFGTPWRSADYNQCCDRIYRYGQDIDVYIYSVLLDTPYMNLTSKMDKILKWSGEMFDNSINSDAVKDNSGNSLLDF